MKKFLLSAAILVLASSPSWAGSTVAIGGGASLNSVGTTANTSSHGLGASVAGASGVQTSIGTGVAVSTPIGGISAGIGQSQGLAGSNAGSIGILGGGGSANSGVLGVGVGVGGGFTNSTP